METDDMHSAYFGKLAKQYVAARKIRVEYDGDQGSRKHQLFTDMLKARSFYMRQNVLGKNPRIVTNQEHGDGEDDGTGRSSQSNEDPCKGK
jgi:hypothetical protein